MRGQIERTLAVAMACAALFAGAAFGASQLGQADAAPSSSELRQLLRKSGAELKELKKANNSLRDIADYTKHTCEAIENHPSGQCY